MGAHSANPGSVVVYFVVDVVVVVVWCLLLLYACCYMPRLVYVCVCVCVCVCVQHNKTTQSEKRLRKVTRPLREVRAE